LRCHRSKSDLYSPSLAVSELQRSRIIMPITKSSTG
jgi:hypothetical protein